MCINRHNIQVQHFRSRVIKFHKKRNEEKCNKVSELMKKFENLPLQTVLIFPVDAFANYDDDLMKNILHEFYHT